MLIDFNASTPFLFMNLYRITHIKNQLVLKCIRVLLVRWLKSFDVQSSVCNTIFLSMKAIYFKERWHIFMGQRYTFFCSDWISGVLWLFIRDRIGNSDFLDHYIASKVSKHISELTTNLYRMTIFKDKHHSKGNNSEKGNLKEKNPTDLKPQKEISTIIQNQS